MISSSPGKSDREATQGRQIFQHLEKEDEGQQEVTTKNPIELEVPVPISSKRDDIAILWNNYQAAKSRAEKSQILDEICRNLKMRRRSANRLDFASLVAVSLVAKTLPSFLSKVRLSDRASKMIA